ncbi:MAG: hypothetical protein JHC87_00780 [Thermoleophilaceae bacterium]|nr:hypothetical protein [Thermoleophilaceae bacterium]
MLSRITFLVALVASVAISVSFLAFVVDDINLYVASTTRQSSSHAAPLPPPIRDQHGRIVNTSRIRIRVDSFADALTSPAEDLVASQSPWNKRLFTFALGMLFWGVGLFWLSRLLSVSSVPRRPGQPADAN